MNTEFFIDATIIPTAASMSPDVLAIANIVKHNFYELRRVMENHQVTPAQPFAGWHLCWERQLFLRNPIDQTKIIETSQLWRTFSWKFDQKNWRAWKIQSDFLPKGRKNDASKTKRSEQQKRRTKKKKLQSENELPRKPSQQRNLLWRKGPLKNLKT